MKKFLSVMLLFVLITNSIYAEDDSLYVEIKNDSVFVWNVNVWEQCAFELEYDIYFSNSIITITEKDTALDMTTCYSYHNFRIPITELATGSYQVDVWRQSWGESSARSIGKVYFDYTNPIEIDSVNMVDKFLIDVNRFKLPMDNKGVLADVRIGNSDSSEVFGGRFDQYSVLYSGGFSLSGYAQDNLWANTMFTTSRMTDYEPGPVGGESQSLYNLLYILRSDDEDFGASWQAWEKAVELGAKFYDGDGNGIYDPVDINENGSWDENEDRPDLIGDITAWSVFNDGTPSMYRMFTNISPMDIEVRQTLFAYSPETYEELDGVVFIRYIIENKSSVRYDSVYFSFMSDPDIGNYADDLVGCDTTINSGFGYDNGVDDVYGNSPTVMFTILQGAQVYIVDETFIDNNSNGVYDDGVDTPLDTANIYNGKYLAEEQYVGAKNQTMTSFIHYLSSHPTQGDADNEFEQRNYMLGYSQKGNLINPCDWSFGTVIDEECSSINSHFMYSGDPVKNIGWINTGHFDQRIMTNSGSFTLEPNKPVEIIVAYVVGRGNTSLASVDATKEIAKDAIGFYSTNFSYVPVGVKDNFISQLPSEFSISQNYPNPFNPSTTIKYSIPTVGSRHASTVQLKVYDILGREVATLVNQQQKPGNYEVTFNASNLTSGIYFYRLQSGSFIESRKMILLK